MGQETSRRIPNLPHESAGALSRINPKRLYPDNTEAFTDEKLGKIFEKARKGIESKGFRDWYAELSPSKRLTCALVVTDYVGRQFDSLAGIIPLVEAHLERLDVVQAYADQVEGRVQAAGTRAERQQLADVCSCAGIGYVLGKT